MIRLGRPLDTRGLDSARDCLTHRGPDGGGTWVGDGSGGVHIGLAHRRLSIIDLSERGLQPLVRDRQGRSRPATGGPVPDATHVMVYNGEIYNFIELRDELRALGHTFSSGTDTEVLLAAYAQWERDALAHLNGMFAFAIWDARRSTLFVARDRFGEKPLYYSVDPVNRSFVFASEIKAVVSLTEMAPSLNPRQLYRYFAFGEQAGVADTVWQGVRRLPPAHLLEVSARGDALRVAMQRYWDIDPRPSERVSESDAIEGFAELFRDSVRLRLRSDVPVGTSLSGGLDSSSVVCQVHALGAEGGQKAFTSRSENPLLDEGRYARAVLDQVGVPGFSVTPTADRFIRELERLARHQEEPFSDSSVFASYLVHDLAREHGVVVLLDGQGADEYLAGYAHYPALALAEAARRGVVRKWWNLRRGIRSRTGADPVPPRAAVAMLLSRLRAPVTTLTVDGPGHGLACLDPAFAESFAHEEARTIDSGQDALRTRLYADLMCGHLQELLRYADRNSMAASRELRLPFLDHRLVEHCFTLPTDYLFRNGESKWVLRRAMTGIVPQAILERRDKVGFATDWSRWWEGPEARALRDLLTTSAEDLRPYVDPRRISAGSAAALSVLSLAAAQRGLSASMPGPLVATAS